MTKMEHAARIALELAGSPYIYATSGQTCTVSLRRRQMDAKPDYADSILRYCPALKSGGSCESCRYNGRRAFDCRGLTYWVLKQTGLSISSVGATTQWTTNSWQERGMIANLPRDRPAILFKRDEDNSGVMAHTGFYLGDGRVVDARGHAKGVLLTELDGYPWTHWAIPYGAEDAVRIEPDVELDDGEAAATQRPLLRKGATGEDVLYLQTALMALGVSLPRYGADGSYGAETQEAVRAWQLRSGLDPDGICGPKTWAAIEAALCPDTQTPEDEEQDEQLYSVTIPGLTREELESLIFAYEGATYVAM